MRQILLFAALTASLSLLAGCALSKAKADTAEDMTDKAAYHKISAEETHEMMASQEVVVVDVRTREEYESGHIENAVLVPNESIGSEMPEALPDKEATLLVYCRSGRRSKDAAQKLLALGYQSVYDFGGVILALRACERGITMDSSFNLAVHALVCLSHSGRSLSSEALAENICTNPTRVRRVLAGLKKAGMVETREGLDGGYRLTADPAMLTLRQVAEAVNTRFVDCAWHSGDIDRDCAICSGMAGVMDALYRNMNEECAAYLSRITITDIETQLFTQK